MEWRSAIGRHWGRWSDAMKRELLREPDRILIDRGPEAVAPPAEQAERLERSLELR
ncbi:MULTISPECIES: hypothetical protein [Sphingobium]|jgi:hypothetical protein|uniref:Uncharacterized protein n=1 Tax=Sphingobium fuliginis (strain ATCC 27551) TaxID=336203 RepID=A0A292ZA32_SPHSA|nr:MULTISPECIES: hypothetical protein [Sphingobium]MCB4859580.1 hypothetical protein [Sphingobium sp. PNB]QOT71513.1 hypothetical protein H5V43_15785 [Sphingobium fuliginis]GAY19693.1 hypothetical protein SFOMI_0213 [Sphingobium fuliginis]